MIQIMLMVCFVFIPQMKLVLKNGKVIACDSYHVKGQMVEIKRLDQIFSLPISAVNLEESGAVNKVEPTDVPKESQRSLKKTRRPVSIKTSDLKSSQKKQENRGTVTYKKIGNSIIVEVQINGSGPYPVLLDTGASTTVISPDIVKDLHLEVYPEEVSLVGLAGRAVQGKRCRLNELSMAGMVVSDLKVVSYEIESLEQLNVIGLLGQDFLNYFIVEMDSSTHKISLKAHGQPVSASLGEQANDLQKQLDRWHISHKKLNTILADLGQMFRSVHTFEKSEKKEASRFLTGTMSDLSSIRADLNQLDQLLGDLDPAVLKPQENTRAEQFRGCSYLYHQMLEKSQVFCRSMRSYVNSTQPDSSQIHEQAEELNTLRREINRCLQ